MKTLFLFIAGLALLFVGTGTTAAGIVETGQGIWSDEPPPTNTLQNGGFEYTNHIVFSKLEFVQDAETVYEGKASARKNFTKQSSSFEVELYQGPVEAGKTYLFSGRMKAGFVSSGGDFGGAASIDALTSIFMKQSGAISRSGWAARQWGQRPWVPFESLLPINPGEGRIRIFVVGRGQPGDSCWLDDLYFGPGEIHLNWNDENGAAGLCQVFSGDGHSFEWRIPHGSQVLAVFKDGKLLKEGGAGDYEVLYIVETIRFFEIPARDSQLALLLKPLAPENRLIVSPIHRYFLYSKAGQVLGWYPSEMPGFKAPTVDYTEIAGAPAAKLDAASLPGQWNLANAGEIRLPIRASGYYSLRLRDTQGRLMRSLCEYRRLPFGGMLQAAFDGRGDDGAPLPPGEYTWEIERQAANPCFVRESVPAPAGAMRMWRRSGGFSFLINNEKSAKATTVAPDAFSAEETLPSALMEEDSKWVLLRVNESMDTASGEKVRLPFAEIGAIVEARNGVIYVFDSKAQAIRKIVNGKCAADFGMGGALPNMGDRVYLALDENGPAPSLYVSHCDTRRPLGLMKFTLNGAPVISFGANCVVGSPVFTAPTAVHVMSDGSLYVGDRAFNAWVVHLTKDGQPLNRFRKWRGQGLVDRFQVEDSEEAYSFLREVFKKINVKVDTRNRRVTDIRVAPNGDLYVTPGFEQEPNREIQVYNASGELLRDIGRGPQILADCHACDYVRTWNRSMVDPYGDIQGFDFNVAGDLVLLDAKHRKIHTISARTATATRQVSLTGTAPAAKETSVATSQAAYPALPAGFSLPDLKTNYDLDCVVADFMDLTVDWPGQGKRDDGTMSIIRRPGNIAYRLSGTAHSSWFRSKMVVTHPGKPHLLVVEYPDDVHRWTMLAVRHDGEWAAASVDWLGVEGGYATGWGFPLTGSNQLYTTFVYPRRSWLTLNFMSFTHSGKPACSYYSYPEPLSPLYGAAASRVWLLEITGDLRTNPVEEPVTGSKRLIGNHQQHFGTFFCDFGAPTEPEEYRRGLAFYQPNWTKASFANLFKFNDYMGFNFFDNVAIDECGALSYPSAVFKNNLHETEDNLKFTLDAAKNQKMDMFFTFFGLQGIPPDRKDLLDKGQVNESGQRSSALSLAYPEVQQYFIDLLMEVVNRYKEYPNFKGVSIMLNATKTPLFFNDFNSPAGSYGYEDQAIQEFEKASGKKVLNPADNEIKELVEATSSKTEVKSTKEKAVFIKKNLMEEWKTWRCALLHQWFCRLRDEIQKSRPDMMLIIYPSYLPGDPRYYGYDAKLYSNEKGMMIYHHSADEWPGFFHNFDDKWKDLKPDKMVDLLEFGHGYFEAYTLWQEQGAASLAPNKLYIPGAFVTGFIRNNPKVITVHSWVRGTIGFDLEFRDFARAFRSLPWAPATELSNAVPAAASGKARIYRFGDSGPLQYVAVVNTTAEPLQFDATIPEATGSIAVRDLVGGKDIIGKKAGNDISFPVSVPPYNLRTYRVGVAR